jgi:predicted dehydrogenase
MAQKTSRRTLIKGAAAGAASYFLTGNTKSLAEENESKSPNEKLNLAIIGVGGRARGNIAGVKSENFVALCDVDENRAAATYKEYPNVPKFADYRNMLDKMGDKIDAVVISTPDHNHCIPAVMAMRMGKHCYCEKPLANTVWETRLMRDTAAEKKVATQMGTQIHSMDNYRRVVEKIQAGAIGPVREAHIYSNAKYRGTPITKYPVTPEGIDWDRWIGPSSYMPFSEKLCPFAWRGYWNFGSGAIGDFGCHYGDLAFWALKLRYPTHVKPFGPAADPVFTTIGAKIEFEFPAREGMPALKYTWYDSDNRPELVTQGKVPNLGSGVLFVGDNGLLQSNYGSHALFPEAKFAEYKAPEPTIPSSIGHHKEWIVACKTGSPTTCNFDYSGALTETVTLGKAAHQCGKGFAWNAEKLEAVNCPEAAQFLKPTVRKGWEI